jgi:hypothetical protein
VTITASAPGPHGTRIGFGEVTGRVEPARTGARTGAGAEPGATPAGGAGGGPSAR